MTLKHLLVLLYMIPLLVFLATTIVAAYADLLGTCYYQNGTIRKCEFWGIDLSALYSTDHLIGRFSDGRFLIFWITLGGCTIWVRDWWIKRNA